MVLNFDLLQLDEEELSKVRFSAGQKERIDKIAGIFAEKFELDVLPLKGFMRLAMRDAQKEFKITAEMAESVDVELRAKIYIHTLQIFKDKMKSMLRNKSEEQLGLLEKIFNEVLGFLREEMRKNVELIREQSYIEFIFLEITKHFSLSPF